MLETALARVTFFLDAEDREWIVRYPDTPGAALALVPLSVGAMARELLGECAEVTVLSSAYLGHRAVLAECFDLDGVRAAALHRRLAVPAGAATRSSIAPSARCRRPPCPGWSPRCSPRWRRSSPRIPATRG